MRNQIEASVRTFVQFVVAAVVAWLIQRQVELPEEVALALEVFLFGLFMAIINLVLNLLAKKLPWVNTIMSLGMSNEAVAYSQPALPPPADE